MCAKKFFDLMLERKMVLAKDLDRLKEPAPSVFNLANVDVFKRFSKGKTLESKPNKPTGNKNDVTQVVSVVMQRIADVDIFRAVNNQALKADDPPPVMITPLPGTERRPLKSWQLLTAFEQCIEMALACSLLIVEELAVMNGICIPDPEDFSLLDNSNTFAMRSKMCSEFRAWYAGEEESNKVPGMGVPSLARVVFAEEFETVFVEKDSFVLNLMLEKKLPVPRRLMPISTDLGEDSDAEEIEENSKVLEDFESLLAAYQKAINTTMGASVRSSVICRALSKVLAGRQLAVVKHLYPPAMNRLGLQYLFPSMASVLPDFQLPLRRLVLFPSRSRQSYSSADVLSWYSGAELDQDDAVMAKAESQGQKMRAYHDWLAKEEERVAESREQMCLEDAYAQSHRAHLQHLEQHLDSHMQELVRLDEELNGQESQKHFRLYGSLPQEYWYIFEESFEYKYGSGLFNEDELEDLRLQQEELARKARQDALEFERYLNEEKKKRDK
ncbi:hypothetical protein EON64_00570 [archaeon]|nr:MAG: hypothetical protein EON64_00570 [archaeon]